VKEIADCRLPIGDSEERADVADKGALTIAIKSHKRQIGNRQLAIGTGIIGNWK